MIGKEGNLRTGIRNSSCLKTPTIFNWQIVLCVQEESATMKNEHAKTQTLLDMLILGLPSISIKWQMVSYLWRNPHCNQLGNDSCTLHQVNH